MSKGVVSSLLGRSLKLHEQFLVRSGGTKRASFRLGSKAKLGDLLLGGYKYRAVFPKVVGHRNQEQNIILLFSLQNSL